MRVNQKRHISSRKTVLLLLAIATFCVVFFMTFNLKGNISYILTHRAWIVLVAFSAATSTLLFQTVTNNRILTPSIMGFESLFVLIQTVVIFFIDAQGIPYIGIVGKFIFESLLLILFSLFLYRGLFTKLKQNLHLVLLIGIILGTLFRSFSNLLQRLMTPTEFAVLQSRIFATFTRAEPVLIVFSLVIATTIGLFYYWSRY